MRTAALKLTQLAVHHIDVHAVAASQSGYRHAWQHALGDQLRFELRRVGSVATARWDGWRL
jgi:hypothetical protein